MFKLKSIIKPQNIVIITALVSFLFWMLPSFSGEIRKGFVERIDVDYQAVVLAIIWITAIYLSSLIGFTTVSRVKFSTRKLDNKASIDDKKPYIIITIFACAGVFYVISGLVSTLGIGGIVAAIVSGQANTLKDTLYSDYSIGPASLRYMAIPAAALALYHSIYKRFILLNLFNIVLLFVVAIISSRLSIIFMIFIFLTIIYTRIKIKIKPLQMLVAGIVIFHMLCALNYSRNIAFYRLIGIDNFYMAGISEIVAYVGSPFQGFLATSEYRDRLYKKSFEDSIYYTRIEPQLNTNSSFLELTQENGVLSAYTVITLCGFFGGMIMAYAQKNKNNIMVILFGVIGYCFAEIWRVFLFGQGIVATLFILTILTAAICLVLPKLSLTFKFEGYRR